MHLFIYISLKWFYFIENFEFNYESLFFNQFCIIDCRITCQFFLNLVSFKLLTSKFKINKFKINKFKINKFKINKFKC